MSSKIWQACQEFQRKFRTALVGPQALAFLPAFTLGGYWFGGEGALLFMALAIPGAFAITGMFSGTGPAWSVARDRETDLMLRSTAEKKIGTILAAQAESGMTTAALVLEIDDFLSIERQNGAKGTTSVLLQVGDRLVQTLRDSDTVVRLDGPRFAVALGPTRRVDLSTMLQMSARLQAVISEPFSIDATRVYATATIGFCLPTRAPSRTGFDLIDCAETALETAKSNGDGSVRAYKPENDRRKKNNIVVQKHAREALEQGQIVPWFQPQISTNTGKLTGFEALARWIHPDRGTISPGDFLPALEEMGLMERLSEVMLSQSLAAYRNWKLAGLQVPQISVNFSSDELSNPTICDRVKWELDRFELDPAILCVEILEDVIAASQDDVIVQNIQNLAEIGCPIDLDDFGTGHASIANIRRFSVNRIKIDRTFITRVDRDREQQNMVAAILTMAERLEIDTLAEGVETTGEHAILAQLGCGHVQGFSVARPMPLEAVEPWISQYYEDLEELPRVGRKIS